MQTSSENISKVFIFKDTKGLTAKCGVTVMSQRKIVIFTELPDNKGLSITNSIELLAKKAYFKYFRNYDAKHITWIEHYPSVDGFPETYSKVEMKFNGNNFKNPLWEHLTDYEVREIGIK